MRWDSWPRTPAGCRSLAARQRFTEQISLITAAFYLPKPKGADAEGTRSAIGLGPEYFVQLEEYKDIEPVKQLAWSTFAIASQKRSRGSEGR